MATNKEIYDALVLLQEQCNFTQNNNCYNCSIRKIVGFCPFVPGFSDCSLKLLRRFTDTDILWAKAAKSSGATEIRKDSETAFAYTDNEQTSMGMICFPASAFKSLKKDEIVQIDDILKEEKYGVMKSTTF